MNYSVFDIEANGLIENATKIHCLCYSQFKNGVQTNYSTTDYSEMRKFFNTEKIVIGHKIVTYDIPMIEKFLGIKYTGRQIDTLGLSWYLYPNRLVHGLEEWGEIFGIPKPKIVDWNNEEPKVYVHRCSEDVRINTRLWDYQLEYLKKIYKDDNTNLDRIIGYLSYKLQCAREQEEVKMKLDIEKCRANLVVLEKLREDKRVILSRIMPKVPVYKIKSRPKIMHRKDGTISKLGTDWFQFLKEKELPEYHNGAVKYITDYEEGNPNSPEQKKEWLFSLGWIPITFKYVKDKNTPYDKKTPPRRVPQINKDDNSGELCDSIINMFDKHPELEELDSYGVLSHRIGLLNGFLESIDENHMLKAEINGFTNTLRFQHKKPIANLPTIPKKYWEMIRECLIAPSDDYMLCGSDMSGLEDKTGRHYMYYYDPKYVDMLENDKSYDAHLHIATEAKLITVKQAEDHKLYDKTKGKEGTSYKVDRLKAKKTNFAAKYLAGPPKIALTANISLEVAKTLHSTYWKINWSIKKVAENATYKTVDTQMWLWNPVSQFWYSLRYTKDIFSTLNQGTGVYAFDTWTRHCRNQDYKICMQYHDEHVSPRLKGTEEETKKILNTAIERTNEELQLNIKLGISIDFGNSYADIH